MTAYCLRLMCERKHVFNNGVLKGDKRIPQRLVPAFHTDKLIGAIQWANKHIIVIILGNSYRNVEDKSCVLHLKCSTISKWSELRR